MFVCGFHPGSSISREANDTFMYFFLSHFLFSFFFLFRFLLGNLAGYNAERDGSLPLDELMDVDRYVLHMLHAFESLWACAVFIK